MASEWDKLREPFEQNQIGHLPKAGKQFPFVSHGYVTQRLLDTFPEYMFYVEPGIVTQGLESDASIGVFARMTIDGVTRMEFGNGRTLKDAVSDAFKRCAMRFGVALDLWIGEEVPASEPAPNQAFRQPKPKVVEADIQASGEVKALEAELLKLYRDAGYADPEGAVKRKRDNAASVEGYKKVLRESIEKGKTAVAAKAAA